MEVGEKRGKSRKFGHLRWCKTIEKLLNHQLNSKYPYLTFYTFSTENWKRPKTEINFLFKLIESYFVKEIDNMIKNNIKN